MTIGRRLTPLLLALGIGTVAYVWLDHINPTLFTVNDDAIRDQLLVRDCTDLGSCHLLGAPSSFGTFFHGAVWLDLLAAVRLLGGGLDVQRTVVLVLLAMTVATVLVVVWHWLRPTLAVPAAMMLLGALSFDTPATLLINPSVAVYPDVLTSAALLCFARSLQWRFLLMSAFSLGVAMSMHTASLTLVVPQLLIVAMVREQGWRDVLATVLIALITYAVPSSATLRANVIALAEIGPVVPMLIAGIVCVFAATACGRLFRRLGWPARAWVIGAMMCAPFSLFLFWLVVVEQHHFTLIYLHPIFAPAAVIIAALIATPFERLSRWHASLGWIPTGVVVVLTAMVMAEVASPIASNAGPPSSWSVRDAAVLADWAERAGWRYDDLMLRIQGNACRELVAGMATVVSMSPTTAIPEGRHLQVLRALSASDAPVGQVVSVGASAALVREIDSWMRPQRLKTCRTPMTGATPICGGANAAVLDAYQPERFLYLRRSVPAIDLQQHPVRPYTTTYEIPLLPIAGESREIQIAGEDSARGWQITRVDGVQSAEPLPATRVRIDADHAGPGVIVFEKVFQAANSAGDMDHYYPPCVLETPVGDPLQERVAGR